MTENKATTRKITEDRKEGKRKRVGGEKRKKKR